MLNPYKQLFPIYQHHPDLVYLDSSATSLKPQVVLDTMNEYYTEYGVNIHRGVYSLSYQATEAYEKARANVASFIHAKPQEIVFTGNVTEALNMIALMLKERLQSQDEVLTTQLEHHSSVLPWQHLTQEKELKLNYIPLTSEGRITVENVKKSITPNTKVLAITYVSNVLGYITPLKEIIELAHEYGIIVIVDAAQAIAHIPVDVASLDCDFLAFSGHKMFGPTGVGVLYGKEAILKTLNPVEYGGDMNDDVDLHSLELKAIPYRFEAGTPMIAEVLGLSRAVDFMREVTYPAIMEHEKNLLSYALSQFKDIPNITLYNEHPDIGILSFNFNGIHPHDAATLFDTHHIAIRAGYHCAQLVARFFNCYGSLRASFHIYNTKEDIDALVSAIKETLVYFQPFLEVKS